MGKNGYFRPTHVVKNYMLYQILQRNYRAQQAQQDRQWRERVELSDRLK